MRIIIGLTVAAAALGLAGCQSEAQVKQRVRDQALNSCKSESAARASQLGGLNIDQFCTCLADKLVENRSVDDLRKMESDKAASTAAGQQAAMQCLSAQMGQLGAPGATPAAEPAAPAATTGANSAEAATNEADTE